jgi:hypothetical protein
VREMGVVTEMLRLKERRGLEPIEEAYGFMRTQADEIAEEYEVVV